MSLKKNEKKRLNSEVSPSLNKERALSIYERMLRIRMAEEAIADEYPAQEMKCPVHLYIGQEAVAAGVSEALSSKDYVLSTHRSHGHYLAQGGDLNSMVAEIYGKSTGCARGKGGSMHLLDTSVGFYGSSAIVGGSISMAVGLAFASQYKGDGRVAVAYFGDGAAEEGVLYESLNFAALKKLPMIFICENNFYSVFTRFDERQVTENIYDRAKAFGVESYLIDGNDPAAVYQTAFQAIRNARMGKGPVFIEATTYRWRTHCGPQWDTPQACRPKEELDEWIEKCPIQKIENILKDEFQVNESLLTKYRAKISAEIKEAFEKAKSSPFPEDRELQEDVLA